MKIIYSKLESVDDEEEAPSFSEPLSETSCKEIPFSKGILESLSQDYEEKQNLLINSGVSNNTNSIKTATTSCEDWQFPEKFDLIAHQRSISDQILTANNDSSSNLTKNTDKQSTFYSQESKVIKKNSKKNFF